MINNEDVSPCLSCDFEGNRAWKTVGTTTTRYLLDDRSPSGYVQVIAEYKTVGSGNTNLHWIYESGHCLISESSADNSAHVPTNAWYYGYDGQGSVRLIVTPSLTPSYVACDCKWLDAVPLGAD